MLKLKTKKAKAPKILSENEIVTRYAEAYRNMKQAEDEVKELKESMQSILKNRDVPYTYVDDVTMVFKLVTGNRANPVGYEEAQTITGFGEANMKKIAGKVDKEKVEAFYALGKVTAEQLKKLLPVAEYLQIRATVQK